MREDVCFWVGEHKWLPPNKSKDNRNSNLYLTYITKFLKEKIVILTKKEMHFIITS